MNAPMHTHVTHRTQNSNDIIDMKIGYAYAIINLLQGAVIYVGSCIDFAACGHAHHQLSASNIDA